MNDSQGVLRHKAQAARIQGYGWLASRPYIVMLLPTIWQGGEGSVPRWLAGTSDPRSRGNCQIGRHKNKSVVAGWSIHLEMTMQLRELCKKRPDETGRGHGRGRGVPAATARCKIRHHLQSQHRLGVRLMMLDGHDDPCRSYYCQSPCRSGPAGGEDGCEPTVVWWNGGMVEW